MPHDREGSFEPLLIGKHERRLGFHGSNVLRNYKSGRRTPLAEPGGVDEPCSPGRMELAAVGTFVGFATLLLTHQVVASNPKAALRPAASR